MAINHPIQGTATGDIIKMAMIKIDEWVRCEKLENEVRMILQVHDELLFEVRKDMAVKVIPEIKERMENTVALDIPLVVETKTGVHWGG